MGQFKAAEVAFMNAINQNPASWNAYYALAFNRFQSTKDAQKVARFKMAQYGGPLILIAVVLSILARRSHRRAAWDVRCIRVEVLSAIVVLAQRLYPNGRPIL